VIKNHDPKKRQLFFGSWLDKSNTSNTLACLMYCFLLVRLLIRQRSNAYLIWCNRKGLSGMQTEFQVENFTFKLIENLKFKIP
jgi:hypothetical protein